MVRKGVVFRSADPTKLTGEGVAVMQTLGIKHVYDFRSRLEFGGPDKPGTEPIEWEGATRHWTPVFANVDLSPEAQAVKMRRFRDYTTGAEVSHFLFFSLVFFLLASSCLFFFSFLFLFLAFRIRTGAWDDGGCRFRLWERCRYRHCGGTSSEKGWSRAAGLVLV